MLEDLLREAKDELAKLVAKAHEMKDQLDIAESSLKQRPPGRCNAAATGPAAKTRAPKAKISREGSRG